MSLSIEDILRSSISYIVFIIILLIIPPVMSSMGLTWPPMVIGYGLAFAITALGFNLLLGYTGLLSFGHAAFFGVGAYIAAYLFQLYKISSIELWLLGAIIGVAILGAVFGLICVRHTKVYFGILTLALSMVLWSLAMKFYLITGGEEGMRIPTANLLGINFFKAIEIDRVLNKADYLIFPYYYYELMIFIICVILMKIIVDSPFGKTLKCIRCNPHRAEFIGVSVMKYRWFAFIISAVFSSVGGVLWGVINGRVNPDALYWVTSGDILFMTVLGGYKFFSGPIIGAIVYQFLDIYFRGYFPQYWQIGLGLVLILIVLLLPSGILGGMISLINRFKSSKGEVGAK